MRQSQVDEGGAESRVVDFRRHTRSSRPVRTVPRVDSKGHLCGARALPCAHAAHAEGRTGLCKGTRVKNGSGYDRGCMQEGRLCNFQADFALCLAHIKEPRSACLAC